MQVLIFTPDDFDAVFLCTPRVVKSRMWSAECALKKRRADLLTIREARSLTGDKFSDWCRGEQRYRERRKYALDGIARCRAEIARCEARLRAFADETTPHEILQQMAAE